MKFGEDLFGDADVVVAGCFEKLFLALDKNLSLLGISSYGVVDTNLEEVFLKVTEHALMAGE